MKWATFDTTSYPTVFVDLGPTLDDEGFQDFIQQWRNLYSERRDFYLIFNTSEVGWVNPKYAWEMASFIEELREQQEKLDGKEYLQQSFIFYKSWYVKLLLNVIFYLQTPIAPVEILPHDKNILDMFRLKNNLSL
jgi:hypothetical protein|tara:strand:+ start:2353 stop:2757 length:405 start_codon:yes stop_codon:yes gene_type:complete